jgi:hypothetical protein
MYPPSLSLQSSICEEPEYDESDDLEPLQPDSLAQQVSGTCSDRPLLLHPGTCGDSLVLQGSLSDWQAQPEAASSPCTSPMKHTGPGAGGHLAQQPPGLEEVGLWAREGQHDTVLPRPIHFVNPTIPDKTPMVGRFGTASSMFHRHIQT